MTRDQRGQLVRELEEGTRFVITPTDAAAILSVDVRTVRRACIQGELPSIRVGAKLLIPGKAFLELLRSGAA